MFKSMNRIASETHYPICGVNEVRHGFSDVLFDDDTSKI